MPHIFLRTGLTAFVVAATLSACTQMSAASQPSFPMEQGRMPGLIVSDEPPPSVLFHPGSRDDLPGAESAIPSEFPSAGNIRSSSYREIEPLRSQRIETAVTHKAIALEHDLQELQDTTENLGDRLRDLQDANDADSSSYYALVASLNSDLQTGTTTGNPILVGRWKTAQDKLNAISQSTGALNSLATDISNLASKGSFLLESVHAAFALSGAVDEDHKKLTVVEEGLEQEVSTINRLMTRINGEITRRSTYLRTERANLQTLSLAVANGELYGQNLSNGVFKKATDSDATLAKTVSSPGTAATRRPLVIIRFDHPNVSYDKPLYTAINQALEKYPAAKFDLVAVSPTEGNPAELALATNTARKNGEAVLRSLTQMGLPVERIHLNAANSKNVLNSEVHIYLQ